LRKHKQNKKENNELLLVLVFILLLQETKSLAEVIKSSRRDSLQIKPQKHKANFWQFLEKERETGRDMGT
jgi:hypothetical protein